MMGILRLLEPRQLDKGSIIYLSVEEVHELFFIMSGCVDIGFEISRKAIYILRLPKRNVIGAYNCTFNQKTMFIYKVSATVSAYTIRKEQWLHHIENADYREITDTMKKNVKQNYHKCIKDRIVLQQQLYMSKMKKKLSSKTNHMVLTLVNVLTDKTALRGAQEDLKAYNAIAENCSETVDAAKDDIKKKLQLLMQCEFKSFRYTQQIS